MLRNHLELEHWKKEHLIQEAFHNVLITTDLILFGGEIKQENRKKNLQFQKNFNDQKTFDMEIFACHKWLKIDNKGKSSLKLPNLSQMCSS